MALRHQHWLVLPLSTMQGDRLAKPVNSGMYVTERNVRLGSAAVIETNLGPMAALGWMAAIHPR